MQNGCRYFGARCALPVSGPRWSHCFWAALVALFTGLLYWVFGEAIIGLFTNIDTVIASAVHYLPWMIVAPLISVWSFQLDGIFIGTGHTREMRNAMIVSLLVYLALLQLTIPVFGNHGLFLGLSVFMLIRALTLIFYFRGIESAIRNNVVKVS